MARHGFEAFPKYQNYLHQDMVWPSESGGDTKFIAQMVPRYAISAHDKLIRWSATMAAKVVLNIYNETDRERYVRATPLAQALMRRAQSLPPAPVAPAPAELTPREVVLLLAPVVAEHTELDIHAIFKLCEAIATRIDEEWTVTLQSR